jgi:hypothetical protein
MKNLSLFLFTVLAGCASVQRSPNSDGATGSQGATGSAGANGQSGGNNAKELYDTSPLCTIASLIVAADDEMKLREYLNAGCSVVQGHEVWSKQTMWDLVAAKGSNKLLKMLLDDPRAMGEINIYKQLPGSIIAHGPSRLPLNPFEAVTYGRVLKDLGTPNAESSLAELFIDDQQVERLKILLSASHSRAKLLDATADILLRLKQSSYSQHPDMQAAIVAIEDRLVSIQGRP